MLLEQAIEDALEEGCRRRKRRLREVLDASLDLAGDDRLDHGEAFSSCRAVIPPVSRTVKTVRLRSS